MGDYIKARLVGGARHNEIIECARLYRIDFPVSLKSLCLADLMREEPQDHNGIMWRKESYFLCRLVSAGGAGYSEYIHESLMEGGSPQPHVLDEPLFPPLPDRLLFRFYDGLFNAFARSRGRGLKSPI